MRMTTIILFALLFVACGQQSVTQGSVATVIYPEYEITIIQNSKPDSQTAVFSYSVKNKTSITLLYSSEIFYRKSSMTKIQMNKDVNSNNYYRPIGALGSTNFVITNTISFSGDFGTLFYIDLTVNFYNSYSVTNYNQLVTF